MAEYMEYINSRDIIGLIVICLPTEHVGVLKNSLKRVRENDRIGIWKCWFLRRGKNRCTRRKTSRRKRQNQQQTQPT